jgi:hypothetical protein
MRQVFLNIHQQERTCAQTRRFSYYRNVKSIEKPIIRKKKKKSFEKEIPTKTGKKLQNLHNNPDELGLLQFRSESVQRNV